MSALRRLFVIIPTAFGAATLTLVSAPAIAQTSDAPIDVTVAPPQSADSVGPAQLRNFSLGGSAPRSTQPATAGTPSPRSATTTAAPPPSASAQRGTDTAVTTARPAAPSASGTRQSIGGGEAQSSAVPTAAPTPEIELTAPQGSAEVVPAPAEPASPPLGDMLSVPAASKGTSLWPWLAAALAAIGGAMLLWWFRRQRQVRQNDPGRLAFAGPQPDTGGTAAPPRASLPQPAPAPKPDPVPSPQPASRPDDGMIISRSLKPALKIEFQPDRMLVSDKEIAVQFDIIVSNDGAAPAREVLVEAALFTAHAGQDEQIAHFFMIPRAQGDRIAAIPPLGRIALKSVVRLPIDQVERFKVEDRDLFVPLVAFNLLYRSGAGEGQASSSFLVGRGTSDDAKLAPFLIEAGTKIINGLSARPHSNGLGR